MPPPNLNILISGAGIAGPCLAWWLHTHFPTTCTITLIERWSTPRTTGQAVDIRSSAVEVIQKMGLEAAIRAKTTTEEGMDFVYADGKTRARFPASGDTEHQGVTSEFEILRGDLAGLMVGLTEGVDGVRYVFGEYITGIEEVRSADAGDENENENGNEDSQHAAAAAAATATPRAGKVKVSFANHLPPQTFDLVVGADGMLSPTRRLVFGTGPGGAQFLHPLGQYIAYFTIPREKEDTKFAQWYNASRGRLIFMRPDPYGQTRAFLGVTDSDRRRFVGIEEAMKEGGEAQQEWFAREFDDAGFTAERVVREMEGSPDWYCQITAQVKMEEFVKGRVALLGDAGFCPSPISGMGTSIAIIGSYLLAGELSKIETLDDIPAALERYQKVARPFIDQVQALFPGAPQIANPQTSLGIKMLNMASGLASSTWVKKFGAAINSLLPVALGKKVWVLPEYPALGGSKGERGVLNGGSLKE